MKKRRVREGQIAGMLKQHEAGVKTADACRKRWDQRRLKLLVAEPSLHGEALKAV